MTAASAPTLELARFRDDLTVVYNPANAVEKMFVEQIATTWQRLTRAQEAEQRYFATTDILVAITKQPKEYKAITRYVADCERAWRHAVLHLEKLQRQRLHPRASKPAPKPEPAVNHPDTPVPNSVLCASAGNSAAGPSPAPSSNLANSATARNSAAPGYPNNRR